MTTTPISGPGFNASTWLSQIKGTTAAAPSPSPAASPAPTSDVVGIPSAVLALLGNSGDAATTGNELAPLFNVSSTDPLSGVYSGLLYTNATTDPVAIAVASANQQAAESAAQSDVMQNLINGLNAASNAYNQTLLAQSQSVLDNNKGLIA